jgi:hypothetical protein
MSEFADALADEVTIDPVNGTIAEPFAVAVAKKDVVGII